MSAILISCDRCAMLQLCTWPQQSRVRIYKHYASCARTLTPRSRSASSTVRYGCHSSADSSGMAGAAAASNSGRKTAAHSAGSLLANSLRPCTMPLASRTPDTEQSTYIAQLAHVADYTRCSKANSPVGTLAWQISHTRRAAPHCGFAWPPP